MKNPVASYLVRNGISQAEFARRLGITPGAVAHYVYDRKKPGPLTAALIERVTAGEITRRELRPDLFT